MPITGIENAIRAIGIVSECLLFVAWATRGRRRPFWLIGFYALYHVLFSVCMLVLHLRRHDLSTGRYYADYAIDFALLSGVIAELFVYTVRPLAAWPPRTRTYMIAGLAFGTLIPILLVISLRFAGFERSRSWDDRLDLLTSLLLCTFLLASAWADVQLRIQRSAQVESIRWGLVCWAGACLIVNLFQMMHAWASSPVFDLVSDASWVFMLLFWAAAVWISGGSETQIIAPCL